MLRSFYRGSSLCLLLVTSVAWASPAPPVADPAAFDAAFATALREGMGTSPEEGAAAVAALRATLPANDPLRLRRFEAMACRAAQRDGKAYIANADTLLAAEQARSAPDATSLALLHACRAAYLRLGTDTTVVERAYDAAVEAAQRSADLVLLGRMLSLRSKAHSLSGEFAKSLMDALAAQDALEDSGEQFAIADNLLNVGVAYRRMGEAARAEEYLLRSLEDEEIRSRWSSTMTALLQLGYLYDETGRYDEARRMLADAVELCQGHDNHAACGYARLGLAGVEVDDGAPRRALATLERAEADFAESGGPGEPTLVALVRGQALARLGRDAEALPLLDRAVATWTTEGNDRYLALALPERARLLERLGREADAIADLRRFIEAHANDDRIRAEQRTELMREQFDASRREVENAELKAREALRLQEIEGLNAARRWQWTAIALGGLLMVVLSGVVVRQITKARRLRLLAMTDPLTGLANRRHTDYRGNEAFKMARLTGRPFCVLAIDIDHFKAVNDTHGHAVGDTVLQRVGRECQRTLRQNDLIGRIGGEEFVGLLPETSLEAAVQVAERIRGGVAALDLDDLVPGLRVTISLGVAALVRHDGDFASLLDRADKALYRAKESGRDRVEVAGPS